jgi:hypothetical protein
MIWWALTSPGGAYPWEVPYLLSSLRLRPDKLSASAWLSLADYLVDHGMPRLALVAREKSLLATL